MTSQETLKNEDTQADIQKHKDTAAFSYLWALSVLIFFSHKDSPFVRYHSKQGIVLFLLSIPALMIPFIGNVLLFLIAIGMFSGFLRASRGEYSDVPIVGDLAKGDISTTDMWKHLIASMRKIVDRLESLGTTSKTNPAEIKKEMDTTPKTPVT